MSSALPAGPAPGAVGDGALFGLFPPGSVVVRATPGMEEAPLHPAEAACIPRAVPKRRREFGLGRACARVALESFGVRDYALLPGPHRAPVWPDGLLGSITHCEDFCGAVVSRRMPLLGLGLDAEPARPFPDEVIRRVCTAPELEHIAALPPAPVPDWFRLVFSAKESVYKACYPMVRRVLEFAEVRIAIDPVAEIFTAEAMSDDLALALDGVALTGRFTFSGDHVITAAWAAVAPDYPRNGGPAWSSRPS